MKKCFPLLFLILILSLSTYGQIQSEEDIKERIIEALAEEIGEGGDFTEAIERIEEFIQNPININLIQREQLEQFYFLNSFQIESLLQYRDRVKTIYTIFELQQVDNVSIEELEMLSALVYFGEAMESDRYSRSKHQVNFRYNETLERAKGFIPDSTAYKKYAGSPQKYLLKFKGEANKKFVYGLTAEKDPGETFLKDDNQYGFDFYSGFFQFNGKKNIQKIIIGDYSVKAGQGLVQWGGYGFGKSAESIDMKKTGQGIKGYTSTDENKFFRGAAATLRFNKFDVTPFYSNKRRDANALFADTIDTELSGASSLQTSGYHRTTAEIEDENAIGEQVAGVVTRYKHDHFAIGMTGTMHKFNTSLQPADRLYNQFEFKGDLNYNAGIDYLVMLHRLHFFGEAAISKSGGMAMISGVEMAPANVANFTLVYRNYSKNYHALHGYAFGEWSGNNNEKGIYAGYMILPFPGWKITGYFDLYQSHWMRYTSNSPVRGNDMQAQLNYSPSRCVDFYLRYKNETNQEKSSTSQTIKQDVDQNVQRLRLNSSWKVNDQFRLKARVEWSHYEKEETSSNGYLAFADLNYTLPSQFLTIWSRIAWYNIPDYDTRIYTYENDVPGYFYIPAFYKNGFRAYVSLKFRFSRSIQLWLKYANTYLPGDETFSSGYNFIDSNKKQDIKVQLRYSF